eukprot:TRINITY_DN2703_c0_g1_i2.p1 TRINITY_DN2703_c0_g1~~TRINITY_DN2703_c0_g1_i2.p1  ORF type:complete len:786 (-),score=200.59 TRINITY_DN2703_c0_g1_i2:89-2446(-)
MEPDRLCVFFQHRLLPNDLNLFRILQDDDELVVIPVEKAEQYAGRDIKWGVRDADETQGKSERKESVDSKDSKGSKDHDHPDDRDGEEGKEGELVAKDAEKEGKSSDGEREDGGKSKIMGFFDGYTPYPWWMNRVDVKDESVLELLLQCERFISIRSCSRETDDTTSLQKTLISDLKNRIADKISADDFMHAWALATELEMLIPEEPNALETLAYIELMNERYENVLELIEHVEKKNLSMIKSVALSHLALHHLDEAMKYADLFQESAAKVSFDEQLSAEVFRAEVLCAKGSKAEAMKILDSITKRVSKHTGACLLLARINRENRNIHRAMQIMLQTIVLDADNAKVRRALGELLSTTTALRYMYQELDESTKSIPGAYSFLGLLAAEAGGLESSKQLFHQCLEIEPDRASHFRHHAMASELMMHYEDAFAMCSKFFELNEKISIGSMTSREIVVLLKQVLPLDQKCCYASIFPYYSLNGKVKNEKIRMLDRKKRPSSPEFPSTDPRSRFHAELPDPSGNEADAQELCLTAIRMMFLSAVWPIPKKLMAAVREGSMRIRKVGKGIGDLELAMYIDRLLDVDGILLQEAFDAQISLPPFYVVGDSHCLSLAWRKVRYRGKDHIFVPRMVAGLQINHLRPDSSHRFKAGFYSVLAGIPPGAPVIFLLGWEDCHKGVARAVRRAMYLSMNAALAHTASFYMSLLSELAASKKWNIFVHPPSPCRILCRVLDRMLRGAAFEYPELQYLDFNVDLCGPDGGPRVNYNLDGIHLRPEYIPLIEKELAKSKF